MWEIKTARAKQKEQTAVRDGTELQMLKDQEINKTQKETQLWFLFITVPFDLVATMLKVYGRSFNRKADKNQNSD